MISRIDILGINNTPMRAVLIPANEKSPNHNIESDKDVIEFYDARYNHTQDGQFITRYYLSTFQEDSENGCGLDLYGGEKDWKIDARTRQLVSDWTAYLTYERP